MTFTWRYIYFPPAYVLSQPVTLQRTLSEEALGRGKHIERPAPKEGPDGSNKEDLMTNNPFYALLGDCYTIVVRIASW